MKHEYIAKRKFFKSLSFLSLFISITLTACTTPINDSNQSHTTPIHTITFNTNGGGAVSKIRKPFGELINKPKDPSKFSFVFEGWYSDYNLIQPVSWPLTLTQDHTFYAAWGKKPLSENEIFNLFKESVFQIKIQNSNRAVVSYGSGFIIKRDGTFITNAHVMNDAWYAYADFDHESIDYEVEWIYQHHQNHDYTIGKLKASSVKTFKPVEITTRYQTGTEVFAVGYPNNAFQRRVSKGEILQTSYRVGGSAINYIRNDADIDHGSSGGILANNQGKVIGITTVGFGLGNYGAIPIDYVANWFSPSPPVPTNRLSPIDFYHPEVRVTITQSNVLNFFSIRVNLNSSFANFGLLTASYTVYSEWIGSDQWYLLNAFSSITIVIEININYSYRTSFNYTSTLNSMKLVTMSHGSINSRLGSDTALGSAYFSINYGTNNTLLSARDTYSVFNAYGTIASR